MPVLHVLQNIFKEGEFAISFILAMRLGKNCDLIKSTFSAKNTANIISRNNQQVQLYSTFQELQHTHVHLPLYTLPKNLAHFFLLLNCVLETIGEHQQDTSEKKTQ